MSEYQLSGPVNAPARQVFDFVSTPENFPKFVPTVREANHDGMGGVRIEGDCPAQHYRGGASLRVDHDLMRMHWDSQANLDYRGRIEVAGEESATVSIYLAFKPAPDNQHNDEFRRLLRDRSGAMQEALEDALTAIRAECEGLPRVEQKRGGFELL